MAGAQTYLRHHQIQEIENEKRVIENTLRSRDVQDRGALTGQISKMDRQLEHGSAPELSPAERDLAARECAQIESRLVPLMPSDEEMRRNPPGTVGRHMRFDKAAKMRDRFPEGELRRWKNHQLSLNRGDADPDVANFERMRPLHNHQASMLGAQIPGKVFVGTNPSPAYMDGYDRTFGGAVVEESTDDVEIAAPRKAVSKKSARKKAGGRKPHTLVAMACGEMKDPRGRRFHEAKCKDCVKISGGN